MNRMDLLNAAIRQFQEDFPDIDKDPHLAYAKGVLDEVRCLRDIEQRKVQGTPALTDAELETLDRLGCYGRSDVGPGPISGYVMHDLDPANKILGDLLHQVAGEAVKMRSEAFRTRHERPA